MLAIAINFPPAATTPPPTTRTSGRWRDASGQPVFVRGPLVIGAGRYRGLGLFVAEEPRRGVV